MLVTQRLQVQNIKAGKSYWTLKEASDAPFKHCLNQYFRWDIVVQLSFIEQAQADDVASLTQCVVHGILNKIIFKKSFSNTVHNKYTYSISKGNDAKFYEKLLCLVT